MKKSTIYLDPSLDRALDRLAKARQTTKADVIRRALAREVAKAPKPRLTAIGIGHGPGDVASDVDRHLSETGFGTP